MRFLALILLAACASRPVPARFDSPIVAYPLNESTLDRDDVASAFNALLRKSAYGQPGEERAGFLIVDGGRFRLEMWPPSHLFHAEEWHGRVPNGTVAVIHTHPPAQPLPSPHDCEEAKRVGIPMLVITPASVALATEDGHMRPLRLGMTEGGCCVAYTDRR
jgi:JAB domain-containing protein similar to deubiquitination enzymes